MAYDKQYAAVRGSQMAYIDVGSGDPIVFLHGNPTSSYLWRKVMTEVEGHGRLVAPDLIGMGDSDKLEPSGPDRYRYVEHREYLFDLLDQLDLGDRVTLVVHDWGSALGFDWAHQHQDRVRGIVYMEAIVKPVTWADWPDNARDIFQGFRSPAGEELVLEKNLFVEGVLPGAVLGPLSDETMTEYRRPYLEPGESRRPTLTWPREIPIEGEPADVHEIVSGYSAWLATTDLPKLFVEAEPGAIIQGETLEFCRSFPNQTIISVPGIHFIQEDSGEAIGKAVGHFVSGLPGT